jgi:SHS2 domain-containing protein
VPLPPFETFDHTADVGLIARGATLPELFQNAALGLSSLLVDPVSAHPCGIRDRVRAEASDLESLLVNWLNEILFLFTVQQMIFVRFDLKSLIEPSSDRKGSVEAEGEGELFDPGRHAVLREIKAATFHGLKIARTPAGWEARVVLDV